ncbi:MAG TPA: EDSAP-1 family PEP-CTERM protein, partial [Nitrococcus sp.]|nr:EDSAP-1 family PEP-CTERM protein [Nitrococcus sp.]
MHSKKSALAAAAALAVGLGSAGTASAYVYAGSGLNLSNLTIGISPDSTNVDITSFNFTATNTATLDGKSAVESNTCNGIPGAPGPTTNNCSGSTPRLDAPPANAPGGTVTRTNNSFTFFGPGSGEFANSDSVINTSELTGDKATNTQQIAESQLVNGSAASSNAEIQSTTGFTFKFTITSGGTLVLAFDADPNLLTQIAEANPGVFTAQSNVRTSFSLTQDNGPGSVTWSPDGTGTNNCLVAGGTACTENNDSQNLNTNVGVHANNTSASNSPAGSTPFGITVTG